MSRTLEVAAPILASQHALVLTRQLTSRGVHRQELKRLVDRGIWERVSASRGARACGDRG